MTSKIMVATSILLALSSFSNAADLKETTFSGLQVKADAIEMVSNTELHAKGGVVIEYRDSALKTEEARISIKDGKPVIDASSITVEQMQ